MRQKDKTILATMTDAYLMMILAALPLYMRDKLTMIGDAKFFLFRNVSIAFGIAAVLCILFRWLTRKERLPFSWSVTDSFVLAYGAAALLSFLLSAYQEEAFWGYPGWYMGLFSQLFFTGAYFLGSRNFEGEKTVWGVTAFSAAAVMGFGVLNRLGIDVLGTLAEVGDWNKIHLISTIGNNNWYAGYISVVAGMMLAAMTACEGRLRVLGMAGSLLYFATAITQGSITGVVAMGAILFCLLLLSLSSRKRLLRAAEALLLLPLSNLLMRLFVRLGLVNMALENSDMEEFFFHGAWYVLLAVFAVFYLFLQYRERSGTPDLLRSGRIQRVAAEITLPVLAVGCLAVLAVCLLGEGEMQLDSGRLPVWRASLQYFSVEDILRKLFGVGPDCLYQALYEKTSLGWGLKTEGMWADAVYVNAHNEWINMLICEGLFGLIAYVGIFVSMLCRVWKRLRHRPEGIAILLGTVGYAACACFTFQHVISTPLLFCLWGMAEAYLRRENSLDL